MKDYSLILIKLSSLGLGLASNFYFAHVFSKSVYAAYAILISVVTIAFIFCNFGVTVSIMKDIPKLIGIDKLMKKLEYDFLSKKLILLLIVPVTLVSSFLVNFEGNSLINFIFLLVSIVAFSRHMYFVSIIRSFSHTKLALFLESNVLNILIVSLVYFGSALDSNAIYRLLTISYVLTSLFSWCCVRLVVKKRNTTMFNDSNGKSNLSIYMLTPFFFLGLIEVITLRLDIFFINTVFGEEYTADYFFAKKFLVVCGLLFYVYNYSNASKLSRLFKDNDDIDKVSIGIIFKQKWHVFILTFIFSFILYFVYDPLLVYFGLEQYQTAKSYLLLFMLYNLLNILTGPVATVLNVSNLSKYTPKVVAFGAFVFVSTIYPLSMYIGPPGVIVALIASLLSWKLLGIYIIRKNYSLNLLR